VCHIFDPLYNGKKYIKLEGQLYEYKVILNNWVGTPILVTSDRQKARERADEFRKIHGDDKVVIRIELSQEYLESRHQQIQSNTEASKPMNDLKKRKTAVIKGKIQVYTK
jgi:hypothetical protein